MKRGFLWQQWNAEDRGWRRLQSRGASTNLWRVKIEFKLKTELWQTHKRIIDWKSLHEFFFDVLIRLLQTNTELAAAVGVIAHSGKLSKTFSSVLGNSNETRFYRRAISARRSFQLRLIDATTLSDSCHGKFFFIGDLGRHAEAVARAAAGWRLLFFPLQVCHRSASAGPHQSLQRTNNSGRWWEIAQRCRTVDHNRAQRL